jgi:hypothetical protein
MRRLRAIGLLALLVLALGSAGVVVKYARAAAFVTRVAGIGGWPGRLAARTAQPVSTTAIDIPWRHGTLPGRRYDPPHPRGRAVLLVPGVHASGIDEPRLVGFAGALAAAGHPVVTAGLADLQHYQITPRSTDMIEDAAGWLASRQPDGRLGMLGISFAGGLSIVAAGRPALRDRVAFVAAVGGHGDLPRVLRYLATGRQPDGGMRPPHDYGLAVVLLNLTDRVVPESERRPLSEGILTFLDASNLDTVHDPAAAAVFARARALAAHLEEPARTYMDAVNDRDVASLGPRLAPILDSLDLPAALSPEESPPPAAPVYLLHGADDNVIPAVESTLLARHLAAQGVEVHLLVTPLVTHAEMDRTAGLGDAVALLRFLTQMMNK